MNEKTFVGTTEEWDRALDAFAQRDATEDDLMPAADFLTTLESLLAQRAQCEQTEEIKLTGHVEDGQLVVHQPAPLPPGLKRVVVELNEVR